eukprot:403360765
MKEAADRGECYYIGDNLVVDPQAKKLVGKKVRKQQRLLMESTQDNSNMIQGGTEYNSPLSKSNLSDQDINNRMTNSPLRYQNLGGGQTPLGDISFQANFFKRRIQSKTNIHSHTQTSFYSPTNKDNNQKQKINIERTQIQLEQRTSDLINSIGQVNAFGNIPFERKQKTLSRKYMRNRSQNYNDTNTKDTTVQHAQSKIKLGNYIQPNLGSYFDFISRVTSKDDLNYNTQNKTSSKRKRKLTLGINPTRNPYISNSDFFLSPKSQTPVKQRSPLKHLSSSDMQSYAEGNFYGLNKQTQNQMLNNTSTATTFMQPDSRIQNNQQQETKQLQSSFSAFSNNMSEEVRRLLDAAKRNNLTRISQTAGSTPVSPTGNRSGGPINAVIGKRNWYKIKNANKLKQQLKSSQQMLSTGKIGSTGQGSGLVNISKQIIDGFQRGKINVSQFPNVGQDDNTKANF